MWWKMPYLFTFALKFKTLLSYWNGHPQTSQIAKFCKKEKLLEFGTIVSWFGYFWSWILKNHCDIGNQQSQVCLVANFCEKVKML